MNTVIVTLLLGLAVPAAPAPKAERGIPKDLIDLLPEDTAAVVVMDVARIAKTEFGTAFWKAFAAAQGDDEPIRVAEVVREVEFALIAQFLIEGYSGDFCFVLRLREGSEFPKDLMAQAKKGGRDATPEKIGKRTVYPIGSPGASFTQLDDRTLMVVLAIGNARQVEETRAAAYGDRDKSGPNAVLRKMLAEEPADVPAIRLYGSHRTKLGHSAGLILAPYGIEFEQLTSMGEKLVSYRGAIGLDGGAHVELRFTLKDSDAAKELLNTYEKGRADDDVVREWRNACKAVRDGDEVIVTGKATRGLIDRLTTNQRK